MPAELVTHPSIETKKSNPTTLVLLNHLMEKEKQQSGTIRTATKAGLIGAGAGIITGATGLGIVVKESLDVAAKSGAKIDLTNPDALEIWLESGEGLKAIAENSSMWGIGAGLLEAGGHIMGLSLLAGAGIAIFELIRRHGTKKEIERLVYKPD